MKILLPERPTSAESATNSQRLEFTVSGMTCGHCVETVSRTLRQSPGVHRVEVNLKEGRAVVTGEHLDPQQLTAAVNSLGYEMHLDNITVTGLYSIATDLQLRLLQPISNHERYASRKHRLGRLRRLDDPRFSQLRHRARRNLQRLSGARRKDRADRHGKSPLCRRSAAEKSRPCVRWKKSITSSATMPSRTTAAHCRR